MDRGIILPLKPVSTKGHCKNNAQIKFMQVNIKEEVLLKPIFGLIFLLKAVAKLQFQLTRERFMDREM